MRIVSLWPAIIWGAANQWLLAIFNLAFTWLIFYRWPMRIHRWIGEPWWEIWFSLMMLLYALILDYQPRLFTCNYNVIMKRVGKICYWRGEKSTNDTNLKKTSGGKAKFIDHFDEYLLTLMFLRRGITMRFLGDLFEVSHTLVTSVIHTWVNVLYQILKHWLI